MAPKRRPAAAPAGVKKAAEPKKAANPLFEKRPKTFGVGGVPPPKKDVHRFVKWPKYVRIQRQRRVLNQRLKVPPALNRFTKAIDKNTAQNIFKLLLKYRPEDKAAKKERLLREAEAREQNKTVEKKRPVVVKFGINHVTTLLKGQDGVIEQARRQLEDLVPVWAVLDYTHTRTIERELLLCKVSILGPEYFEDQLAHKIEEARAAESVQNASESHQSGGASLAAESEQARQGSGLEAGSPASQSAEATQQAAADAHPGVGSTTDFYTPPRHTLTPSEALRQKHLHFQAISHLASQFQGKIVDVSNDCVTVEVSGKTSRIDACLKLLRPYGILEAARTGMMVMPRSHVESPWAGMADEEAQVETEVMDATLLPPG